MDMGIGDLWWGEQEEDLILVIQECQELQFMMVWDRWALRNLTKRGGASVKFDTFDGAKDKKNAMVFLQQFDAAFAGGNFTEISKIRKAVSLLKGNALQWWSSMQLSGRPPLTWVDFKKLFIHIG